MMQARLGMLSVTYGCWSALVSIGLACVAAGWLAPWDVVNSLSRATEPSPAAPAGSTHWAFVPPRRPPLPAVRHHDWPRNPLDVFVLARLENLGWEPGREAPREQLIRRITLDLTGLPPSPEEVDAFLADGAPDAYERLVARLLASPRFGEHLAVPWLDLARYADTHGYHADSHRDMWLWRDWVVEALNANMPFDQFTVEQVAGDLLPHATVAQRVASGFHRNTMLNAEEGALPDEYLAEYVAERVSTTATTWLGLTLGCARCHEHKYDPFTQADFYRLFACFHNVPEQGLDGRQGNAAPKLTVATPAQQWQLDEFELRLRELGEQLEARRDLMATRREAWSRELAEGYRSEPPPEAARYWALDETAGVELHAADGSVAGRWQGTPQWLAAGKHGGAALFDGNSSAVLVLPAAADQPPDEQGQAFALWVFPTTRDAMTLMTFAADAGSVRRLVVEIQNGRPQVWCERRGGEVAGWLQAPAPLAQRKWQHLVINVLPEPTADEKGQSLSLQWFVQGTAVAGARVDRPAPEVSDTSRGWRLGGGAGRGFRGLLDDVRWLPRALTAAEAAALAGTDPIAQILAVPAARRTQGQWDSLLEHYLTRWDAAYGQAVAEQRRLRDAQSQLRASLATTMVMEERQPPRATFVLARGDYRSPGQQVWPDTPAVLPPWPPDAPRNRLGLARWLVDPRHPLTARVTVNRYWQAHFGVGLVRTSEDFGVRGEPPTHPELLDWLAVEFIESGWDIKRLQALIVTSATYRQTSHVPASAFTRDPENHWLGRFPRVRLPAESIRDSALFAAGLLQERLGGPGVFPYQPPGLWEELAYDAEKYTAQRYVQSHGAELYRRSLYTFWKRTSPPPALAIFDAPNRETCLARRGRSNTPLQALVLMNDPTFVEAARGLAERTLRQERAPNERLRRMFRRLVGRSPSAEETQWLQDLRLGLEQEYGADDQAAEQLLRVGESPASAQLPAGELAVWTALASTLMNLDESISRP